MKDGPLVPRWEWRKLGDTEGKHSDCYKFVLDLDHDPFALIALLSYAEACIQTHPLLALDLFDRCIVTCEGNGVLEQIGELHPDVQARLKGAVDIVAMLRRSIENRPSKK